jgi:hypothetical protein
MAQTFSEWLKAQGYDELTLEKDRRNQLMTFFQEKMAEPPPPPSKDSAGADLHIGDTVTISFKISGIHQAVEGTTLNLDRFLSGGGSEHTISVPSDWVKKS